MILQNFKKITPLSLIFSIFISFVLPQHINAYAHEQKTKKKFIIAKSKMIKSLDRDILKAKRKNESVDETISRLNDKITREFYKTAAKTYKVLSKANSYKIKVILQKRLDRLKRTSFKTPERILEIEEIKKALHPSGDRLTALHKVFEKMFSSDRIKKYKENFFSIIRNAGSYENYLIELKEEVANITFDNNDRIGHRTVYRSRNPFSIQIEDMVAVVALSVVGILLYTVLFFIFPGITLASLLYVIAAGGTVSLGSMALTIPD